MTPLLFGRNPKLPEKKAQLIGNVIDLLRDGHGIDVADLGIIMEQP